MSYIIDTETRIAHVSGKIDPGTLLMNLAKAGKHAELRWVEFDWHHHHQYTPSAPPAGLMATDMVDGYGYGSDGHRAYCDHHGYGPYHHDYYGRMMDPYHHPYYSSYNDLPQPHFLHAPPVPKNSSFYDPDWQSVPAQDIGH